MARREAGAKISEIPGLLPMPEELNLGGMAATVYRCAGSGRPPAGSPEAWARTTSWPEANQPSLPDAITGRLAGTDGEFAGGPAGTQTDRLRYHQPPPPPSPLLVTGTFWKKSTPA